MVAQKRETLSIAMGWNRSLRQIRFGFSTSPSRDFRLEQVQSAYGQASFAMSKSLRVATPSRIARALARMLVANEAACRVF
jgi:hypothetical protein